MSKASEHFAHGARRHLTGQTVDVDLLVLVLLAHQRLRLHAGHPVRTGSQRWAQDSVTAPLSKIGNNTRRSRSVNVRTLICWIGLGVKSWEKKRGNDIWINVMCYAWPMRTIPFYYGMAAPICKDSQRERDTHVLIIIITLWLRHTHRQAHTSEAFFTLLRQLFAVKTTNWTGQSD